MDDENVSEKSEAVGPGEFGGLNGQTRRERPFGRSTRNRQPANPAPAKFDVENAAGSMPATQPPV
jgi:hypothetical protein